MVPFTAVSRDFYLIESDQTRLAGQPSFLFSEYRRLFVLGKAAGDGKTLLTPSSV